MTNPPTRKHLSVGDEVPADLPDCCQGLLYLVSMEAELLENSEQLPGTLVFDQHMRVGVLRCAPTVSDTGQQPSEAEETAATRQVLVDQMRLMRTLVTYVLSLPMVSDGDLSQVTANQLPPSGGCCGAYVDFLVRIIEYCPVT